MSVCLAGRVRRTHTQTEGRCQNYYTRHVRDMGCNNRLWSLYYVSWQWHFIYQQISVNKFTWIIFIYRCNISNRPSWTASHLLWHLPPYETESISVVPNVIYHWRPPVLWHATKYINWVTYYLQSVIGWKPVPPITFSSVSLLEMQLSIQIILGHSHLIFRFVFPPIAP